eukprot:TRINITY_DN9775_c0_g1_i1.p1 TRINITY_DN9775_c0_g1~~TRINITY_DN9775_c0_g1_i1.p1  ORF type:complete len:195 (-),score=49.40 TRINITY_DN9775_c0_g1_i1:30-614(-)
MLNIEPNQLNFGATFQGTKSLTLTNESGNFIAFKVKTTAPRTYCVRPNAGLVAPGSEAVVEVLLRGAKDDSEDKVRRDKFQVLWFELDEAPADGESHSNFAKDLWKNSALIKGSNVQKKKLVCFWSPPSSHKPSDGGIGGDGDPVKIIENSNQMFSTDDDSSGSYKLYYLLALAIAVVGVVLYTQTDLLESITN